MVIYFTYLSPCNSQVMVKEKLSYGAQQQILNKPNLQDNSLTLTIEHLGQSIFCRNTSDHKLAPSIGETLLLQIMVNKVCQDSSNSWVAPLPFQTPRRKLPNNREYAYSRLTSLCQTLAKRPQMQEHFLEFMQQMLINDHAEVMPPLQEGQECWYLPSFEVYHPKKPEQSRVVFDSSALI